MLYGVSMASKKKPSYEQSLAAQKGLDRIADNRRRRWTRDAAATKADERRASDEAARSARLLEARNGLQVGERVRGLEAYRRLHWYEGLVQDGDLKEGGFPVLCDDGETRYLLRNRTERIV